MLQLVDVAKSFYDPRRGEVRAIDGIDLELEAGTVALVGANGAGKSTLLRMVATLMRPDRGSLCFDGVEIQSQPDALRRRLGYLSTTTRLYPRLTAREMLGYAGGFHGLRGTQLVARIATLTATFGLEAFLDSRCDALSTGQAQRVNLARTLLVDPDLLVLDEPTTGLDIAAARLVVEAVRAARRPGRLIIIATHIMAEVESLAERLLILRQGQLAFDGAPAALGEGAGLLAAVHDLVAADHAFEAGHGA